MLENDKDLFQLKSSFVTFRLGTVSILVHNAATNLLSKLPLHKFYALTQRTGATFQMRIVNDDKYFAVNSETTMFTTLSDLEKCTTMINTYLCNDVKLLQKVNAESCLFNLSSKNGKSREVCYYKVCSEM